MWQRLRSFVGLVVWCSLGLVTSIWGWIPTLVGGSTGWFLVVTGALAAAIAWRSARQ